MTRIEQIKADLIGVIITTHHTQIWLVINAYIIKV